MTRSAILSTVILASLLAAASRADESAVAKTQRNESADHPFHTTNVWQIHIEVAADEYAAMQPRGGGGGFFGFGRRSSAPAKLADDRVQDLHRNQFGVDLPWAKGTMTIGEQTFGNVGVRYKGNGTIGDSQGSIKKSLKIDLDRFGGKETFLGHKTVNLHCGVTDPTKCRETLAYGLYREAGVAAPRTALAEVRLTVPGQFDKQLLGLYTMVENVGGSFLRAHFESDDGLLMKPENVRDIEYLSAYWPAYEPKLEPKRKATDEEAERVIALARLIHKADDATFGREIESFIDVNEYLRFLAVTAYLANSDSFFMLGHNYYLYLHPTTGRFHFIPWDLDRAFANFFLLGSNEQQMDLSLRHPYAGEHRLTERLLGIPEVSARYDALLAEMAESFFAKERLLAALENVEQAMSEAKERDDEAVEANRVGGESRRRPPPGMMGAPPDLRTFIDRRTESMAGQLSGATTGHVPRGGGPFGFPPRDGERPRDAER